MQTGWLLLVAGLAACGDTSGAIIRVQVPDTAAAVTHVRFFVGLAELYDHADTWIAPAQTDTTALAPRFGASGPVWVRDPEDHGYLARVENGQATFAFTPADATTELGAVIAVGYADGDPQLFATAVIHPAIDTGDLYVYDRELAPVYDPSIAANRTESGLLQLWGPEGSGGLDQPCVYFKGDVGSDHGEGFLVRSEKDRDCDGLEDGFADATRRECLPSVHLGQRPPSLGELSCLRSGIMPSAGVNIDACVLGGPTCIDNAPAAARCDESRFCMPGDACSACLQSPAPWACLLGPNSGTTLAPSMVKCDVVAKRESATGVVLCDGTSVALPLIGAPIPSDFKCVEALVRDLDHGFASALIDSSSSVSGGAATYDVDVDGSCGLTLRVEGAYDQWPDSRVLRGLVAIQLDQVESLPHRELAMPIEITVMGSDACPAAPSPAVSCKYVADANDALLDACLHAPPPR